MSTSNFYILYHLQEFESLDKSSSSLPKKEITKTSSNSTRKIEMISTFESTTISTKKKISMYCNLSVSYLYYAKILKCYA